MATVTVTPELLKKVAEGRVTRWNGPGRPRTPYAGLRLPVGDAGETAAFDRAFPGGMVLEPMADGGIRVVPAEKATDGSCHVTVTECGQNGSGGVK